MDCAGWAVEGVLIKKRYTIYPRDGDGNYWGAFAFLGTCVCVCVCVLFFLFVFYVRWVRATGCLGFDCCWVYVLFFFFVLAALRFCSFYLSPVIPLPPPSYRVPLLVEISLCFGVFLDITGAPEVVGWTSGYGRIQTAINGSNKKKKKKKVTLAGSSHAR
ncbi:hypothetical protein FN846DRAFT_114537 [Sphaerosporella brunnea]|uniref:Uncharacterized protein n=1 Tax=Sphaerosporella brunnea TaxID=1250544 RepID=A0A5J5ES07_9PEZI|nr:hypothetical protein FN846DRAFT_114537 [Sphaerosporella brunnea]